MWYGRRSLVRLGRPSDRGVTSAAFALGRRASVQEQHVSRARVYRTMHYAIPHFFAMASPPKSFEIAPPAVSSFVGERLDSRPRPRPHVHPAVTKRTPKHF